MRVGVVTTSYPRWPGDHAGNFVAAHVRALQSAGHVVEVIAAGGDRDAGGEHDPAVVERVPGGEHDPAVGERVPGGEHDPAVGERVPGGEHDPAVVERVPGGALFYAGGAPDHLERSPVRGSVDAAAFSARMTAAIARRAPTWDAIVAHWIAPCALAVLTARSLSPLAALPSAVASLSRLRKLPLVPAVAGFVGQLAPTRTPLLAIAHGGDIHTLRRAGLLAPALFALHAADARLVFVSEELRAIALAAAPRLARWLDTALVQPMGIDVAHFASLPRSPTTPPTIACIARMTRVKGIDVLLDALPYVRTPVRVVIAGDGPERDALAERARRIADTNAARTAMPTPAGHSTGAIEIAGANERDRVLSIASVVVVPSRVIDGRTEGAPLIAIESLAAGVPVIASDVGGLREIDRGGRAVRLVPPDDPRALAAAIDAALTSPPTVGELRAVVGDRDWSVVGCRLMPGW